MLTEKNERKYIDDDNKCVKMVLLWTKIKVSAITMALGNLGSIRGHSLAGFEPWLAVRGQTGQIAPWPCRYRNG